MRKFFEYIYFFTVAAYMANKVAYIGLTLFQNQWYPIKQV